MIQDKFTTERYVAPSDANVKKYKNGYAIELKYGMKWINLHSLVFDFPSTYYYDSEEKANKDLKYILKLIGK